MRIANFTPDPIVWQYGGETGTIKPDQEIEMGRNQAIHILKKFGPRGLRHLLHGDSRVAKKMRAMEVWAMFWEKNIQRFNQDNEDRKWHKMELLYASKELIEHAKTLKVRLIDAPAEQASDKFFAEKKKELLNCHETYEKDLINGGSYRKIEGLEYLSVFPWWGKKTL